MNLDSDKEFPYKLSLACQLKSLYPKEKDEYIALASLEKIKKFIPEIDEFNQLTLLPVAFNAFVCNMANRNDDVINKETTLEIYENFVNHPIDLEHRRDHNIGVILTAGFSKFGTDESLTEEQVKKLDKDEPFNVVLGGCLWRIVNPKLMDLVEESSDPESEKYLSISASWELGFKNFNIVILDEGSKSLKNATYITGSNVEKCKRYLKAFGGTGIMNDRRIVRMPTGNVLPLAMALTEKPAADVKGIATASEKGNFSEEKEHFPKSEDEYINDKSADLYDHDIFDIQDDTPQSDKEIEGRIKLLLSTLKKLKNGDINKDEFQEKTGINVLFAKILVNYFIDKNNNKNNNKNNISHSSNLCVNSFENDMKISKIEDITDESLKQCNASVITSFIKEELAKADKVWSAEKEAKEKALASVEKTQEDLKNIKATLDEMNKKVQDREKLDAFNARMTEVEASYNLDDEMKAALVEEIKAIATEEDFNKWKAKAKVILKAYARKMSKSEKDSAEQQKEWRETNMNAKKKKDGKGKDGKDGDEDGEDDGKDGKKSKADSQSMATNEIGEDNKGPGQDGNDEMKSPQEVDEDNQFVDRDGAEKNAHDGEDNGEHPNEIARDNWNKGPKQKDGKNAPKGQNDDGHNAGASVIEDALDNADKEKAIANTSSSSIKKQSLKEKYASAFASENFIVNGKNLEKQKV